MVYVMKLRIMMILFLLIPAQALLAVDWSAKGFTVKSSETTDQETQLHMVDEAGKIVTVRYYGELSDEDAEKVSEMVGRFAKWEFLDVRQYDFYLANNTVEVVVTPAKYTWGTTDIVPHLPAGMRFSGEKKLYYNFRVVKDNIFVPLKGELIDEENLSKLLVEVIKDPLLYLQKRNPEFFYRKLMELQENQEKLQYAVMTLHNKGFLGIGMTPVKKKTVVKVIAMKEKDPSLDKKTIAEKLKEEGLDTSEKEVGLILNVFFNEFD